MGNEILEVVWQSLNSLALAGVGALTLVITAFAAQRWTQRRRRRNPAFKRLHPLCRRCEYLLVGLQGGNCPECGSDLREPRTIALTTRRQQWWKRGQLLVASIIFAGVWLFMSEQATAPKLRAVRIEMLSPASQAYDKVIVTATDMHVQANLVDRIRRQVDLSQLTVVYVDLVRFNTRNDYAIVLDNFMLQTGNPGMTAVAAAGFSPDTLAGWFHDAGVDVEAPQVKDELTAITTVVHRLLEGREPQRAIAMPFFQVVQNEHLSVALPQSPGMMINRLREPPLLVLYTLTLIIFGAPAVFVMLMGVRWQRHNQLQQLDATGLPLDVKRMCLLH